MHRSIGIIVATTALSLAPAAQAAPELVDVAETTAPVYVASPPEDPSRVFVVEQQGEIRVVDHGRLLERRFLDLSGRVRSGGLRGLLSMAFAPDYERSRRFYVYFTDRHDRVRVEEYRRSRSNPNVARPSSMRKILTLQLPDLPPTDSPHLGGQLQFGPDGFLYISTGDGSRGFKDSRLTRAAQQRRSLFGKVLRIDPVAQHRRYAVPDSNPYVGRRGRDEIFARGLRNPWRFSFDGRRMVLADDGEESFEEVNLLRIRRLRGANFGWPAFEATHPLTPNARRKGLTMPIFEYPHRSDTYLGEDCAGGVIGGYIVRDPTLPSLYGRYVYGDYCFFEVRSFDPRDPEGTDRLEFATSPPYSFGEDATGRIYVAFEGGRVAQLVESEP